MGLSLPGVPLRSFGSPTRKGELGDEPEDANGLGVRELPFERDHVVELEELAFGDRDPELERSRVLAADDPAGYLGFGHSA
jgi:hypothetical protein